MKKLFLLVAFLVMGLSVAPSASCQESEKSYVHCILLDNTLSMIGRGGGQNIWSDVQSYCYSWVDGIKYPCTIVFFTYARDLSNPQIIEVNSESDRAKVKDAIKNVVIDGRHTWIASNLKKAWEYLCSNYKNDIKKIYLITDGKEEEMNSSMDAVIKDYSAARGDYDHLYYVDLNGNIDENTREILDGPGMSVGKGFCEFYTVSPAFMEINYTIGRTPSVTQLFHTSGKDVSQFSFEAEVESVSRQGVNVMVSPKKKFFKDLDKRGDEYVCDFSLDFLNNSVSECDVVVKLVGSSDGENELKIEPSTFTIKVRKRKFDVYVEGDGWGE